MANSTNRKLLADYLLGQQSSALGKNYVKNSSAFLNTNNVSVANSATVARNTTTPLTAESDFSITLPNNTNGYVEWSLGSLDRSAYGKNCEARLDYTASSLGSAVKAQIYQGSTLIAESPILSATSQVRPISINSPCGDGSSATTIRLANVSGNSGTSAVKVANVLYGLATNLTSVVQGAKFYGSVVSAVATSCQWSTTSAAWASFAADADCATPTAVGNAQAPATKIPGVKFAYLPAGRYQFIATGYFQKGNAAARDTYVRFYDGTNGFSDQGSYFSSDNGPNVIVGNVSYSSAQSNITIELQARLSGGDSFYIRGDLASFEISVIYYPDAAAEVAYRPDQSGAYWSGNHGADCVFQTSSGSFADYGSDSTCTFSESQNRNFGSVSSTLSAGNKTPGITFTAPYTGRYLISANVSVAGSVNGEGYYYRLYDGTSALSVQAMVTKGAGGSGYVSMLPMTAIVSLNAGATSTLKIQGYAGSGTGYINGNAGVSNAVEWSIVPLDVSLPAPILVGSITSSGSGAMRMESARIASLDNGTACTSSPCSVFRKSSDWLSSVTRTGTGDYALNFASGTFGTAPICVASKVDATGVCSPQGTSASGMTNLICVNQADTVTDGGIDIICMGPKV